MTEESSRSKHPAIAFLDWDNVRVGAWRERHNVDPVVILEALIETIRKRLPPDVNPPKEVRLYFAASQENRVDRSRLRQALPGIRIEVRPSWEDKDMADIELTIDAITVAVLDEASHIVIVSEDNDLARVAQEIARRLKRAKREGKMLFGAFFKPTILHQEDERERTRTLVLKGWHTSLERREVKRHRRPMNKWDEAAWALRTAFSDRMGVDAGKAYLEDATEHWWKTSVLGKNSLGSYEVAVVDSVLALLGKWALDARPVGSNPPIASAGLAERLTFECASVEEEDASDIVAALQDTGLLRFRDRDHFDVPMYSFEGVLFPVRRALLLLPRSPHPRRLREDIEDKFRTGVPACEAMSDRERDLYLAVADEEWKMVERVLLNRRLGAVGFEKPEPRRRSDPRLWWFNEKNPSAFAVETFETARLLLAHVDTHTPQPKAALLSRFAAAVPRFEYEWLQTLAKTGLIKKDHGGEGGGWVLGDIELGQGIGPDQPTKPR